MSALRRLAAGPAGRLGVAVVVLALTVIMRRHFHTDADVAWLISAAERMLDGAVLYRDIIEPNPPASILLYVPAVLLARATGLRPEAVGDALVAAGLVASLWGTLAILMRAGLTAGLRATVLFGLSLAILAILPLGTFSQREHIVVGLMLPCLACLAARSSGSVPHPAAIVLAGVAAGLAVSVKPIFGLALVGPAIEMMMRQSWTRLLLLPEAWIAGAVASLYAVAVAVLVPDFASRVLPLVLDIYLPARTPLLDLLRLPLLWICLGLLATFWQLGGRTDLFGRAMALASIGFAACFFIQGKGFHYHGLPAIMAAAMACASALARLEPGPASRLSLVAVRAIPAAFALFIAQHQFAAQLDMSRFAPGLREAVAATAPVPRLLTIGTDGEAGPALAREIGADWVGSAPTAWVTLYASLIAPRPESDARFVGPIRQEQARYAADITRGRPDVLLIEGDDWIGWARRSPALAAALDGYRETARYGEVVMFRPRPAGETAGLRPTAGAVDGLE